MNKSKMIVGTELFQWLNKQTDLTGYQVDLVDGFVFMLTKINIHHSIRLIGERKLHPRFWRSHDRTFGYRLMRKKGNKRSAHLYRFYINVAFSENFVRKRGNEIQITETGKMYLQKKRDEQLDLLFSYIW